MPNEQFIFDAVKELVGNGILAAVLYFIVSGKLKTEGHHNEVVRLREESEKRAWESAEKAEKALAANNEVLRQYAESVRQLTTAVENLRARR